MKISMSLIFARRLREVQQLLGATQQNLSEILQISQPAISTYLQGRLPPVDLLFRLARISGKSMEWFLSEEPRASQVREPAVPYSTHAKLLALWDRLPAPLQFQLMDLILEMLRQLGDERKPPVESGG